jgi:hypothetical protein
MSQTPLFPPAAAGTEGHSQISTSILFCLTQSRHSLSKNGEVYRIELDEPKTLDRQAQMISQVAERQCYFIDLMPEGDSMRITAYDKNMAKQVEFTDQYPTTQMLDNRLKAITLRLPPLSQAQAT